MMNALERRFFPQTREWVCGRAIGDTLEIAVGTGLNLPHYGPDVHLVAVDRDQELLAEAHRRATSLGMDCTFHTADALSLPFPDASFDSVVCTFAMCEVADVDRALAEAARVLRCGGRLLLADHVTSDARLIRWGQRLLEAITIRASGEHFTRRPHHHLRASGLQVVEADRRAHGVIEHLHIRHSRPC